MYMIRLATNNDLENIMKIIKEIKLEMQQLNNPQWSEKDDYPNEEIFKDDIYYNTLYVLEEENTIKGLICIDYTKRTYKQKAISNDQGKYYEINRVAVNSAYRSQNIAVRLMKFAEGIALKNNIYLLKSSTEKSNVKIHKLFLKLWYSQKELFCYNNYPGQYYSYEKKL